MIGRMRAGIAQLVGRADDVDRSPSVWFWHSMIEPLRAGRGSPRAYRLLGSPPFGPIALSGRPERPVEIPWRKVRHGHTPKFLPNRVAARQLFELGVADRQRLRIVGLAIAVNVQLGAAIDDIHDLDDQAAVGRNPGGSLAIVVAGRHGDANREIQEILDVARLPGG